MGSISRVGKSVAISKLKPYKNNAKIHNNAQLEKIAKSIQEFGFLNPVIIDNEYNVIAGHGRIEAAKLLRLDRVPCIFIEGLSEAERRAYTLADNRLSEFATWDEEIVIDELEDLSEFEIGFDLSELEFDEVLESESLSDPRDYYGDERERTNKTYNLGIAHDTELSSDFWQMPLIKNDFCIPSRLIGFNYAKTCKDKKAGIHFFIDDYQFERVWNQPEKYVDVLKDYECILSPDFSLYMDMPMPMKIWNIYRSRQIGAFYQSKGIKVIPTISWAEPETYCFCFEGLETGGIIAVSTVGVLRSEKSIEIFKDGLNAAIEKLQPQKIVLYGGLIDFDFRGIEVIEFKNEVTDRWQS